MLTPSSITKAKIILKLSMTTIHYPLFVMMLNGYTGFSIDNLNLLLSKMKRPKPLLHKIRLYIRMATKSVVRKLITIT